MENKNIIIIKKDDSFGYLILSLIHESLLYKYIITSSKLNNEVNEYALFKKNHSFLIERKLILFINELINKTKFAIENKTELKINSEESLFIKDVVSYSWFNSLKFEKIFKEEVFFKTIETL